MKRLHVLKEWPSAFEAVASGKKKAEIRFNDRDFKEADELQLKEYLPDERKYTGREALVKVTHMQQGFGLPTGYVALSFELLIVRASCVR